MAELREESFWKASVALQSNRLDDSYRFLSQAIEQLDQPYLTLEQVDLVWTVISRMLSRSRQSIDRLVHYHRSMPIETDEVFDRLTQAYVNELEKDQVIFCQTLIQAFDRHLVRDHRDAIDHIHWRRLQSDLYLQLSHVSRPYQSRLFYNVHRKLFEENEQIIAMDRDRHIDHH